MLIQKHTRIEEGAKLGFKLATGDDVIGEVASLDDSTITLSRPKRVVLTQQGAILAPYSFLAEQDANVTFYRSQLVSYVALSHDVENDYIRASTGIQI